MKKILGKKVRLGSAGLTLVELVISLAILAIVGIAVGGAMYVSSRSYATGTAEINVQEEAQVASNLISDWLMDATEVDPANGSGTTLKITHVDDEMGPVEITIARSGDELTYSYHDPADLDPDNFVTGVIAKRVSGVNFYSTFDTNRNVRMSLDFNVDNRTFHAVSDSTSRNHDFVSTSSDTPMGPPVISFEGIVAVGGQYYVYLEPGQNDTHTNTTTGVSSSFVFNAKLHNCDPDDTTLTLSSAVGNTTMTATRDGSTNVYNVKCTSTDTAMTGGTYTFTASNSNGSDTKTVTVLIRRATKCEASVDEAVLVSGSVGSAGAEYQAVTVDTGAQNNDPHITAWYDAGVYGYKDATQVNFFYRMKDDSGIWQDASSYVNAVEVNNGTPSVQIKLTTELPRDLYVVCVASHSGYLGATNASCGAGCYGDNKVTSIMGTSGFTYTGLASTYAYFDTFKIKAGESLMNTNGSGFKRGTQAFKVCKFVDNLESKIAAMVPNYTNQKYSVVMKYKSDAPGSTWQTYVVSVYSWGDFIAKKDKEAVTLRNTATTLFNLPTSYSINIELYATDSAGNNTLLSSSGCTMPATIPYIADSSDHYIFKTDTYGAMDDYYQYHRGTPKDFYVYLSGFDNEYAYLGFVVEEVFDDNGDGVPDRSTPYTCAELQEKEKVASGNSYFSNVKLVDGTTYELHGYNENAYPDSPVNARRVYLGGNENFQSGHIYRIRYSCVYQQYDHTSGVIGQSAGSMGGTCTSTTYNLVGTDTNGAKYGYIYIRG